ncbi:MAG: hypothetical protein HND53_02460 [Proteobacteria bacterium]|nr:hypothetical protein [Pseudomonadota bacterium]NOG59334.1 hypothetical protein [Pseudomonadota bacterium]
MLTNENKNRLFLFLFPDKQRDLPFRLTIRITFRTLHILCTGILLGGHVFNMPVAILEPWLWAVIISGFLIFLTDLHSSCIVLFEFRGIAVLTKIALLLLIPIFWDQRIIILICILVIGSVSSHLPKRYRHKLLFFNDKLQNKD